MYICKVFLEFLSFSQSYGIQFRTVTSSKFISEDRGGREARIKKYQLKNEEKEGGRIIGEGCGVREEGIGRDAEEELQERRWKGAVCGGRRTLQIPVNRIQLRCYREYR